MTTDNLLHRLRAFPGGELGNEAADEIEALRRESAPDHGEIVSQWLRKHQQELVSNRDAIMLGKLQDLGWMYEPSYDMLIAPITASRPFTIETVSKWLETQGLCAVSKADAERVRSSARGRKIGDELRRQIDDGEIP